MTDPKFSKPLLLTHDQSAAVFEVIDDHIDAMHNWIAGAVEAGAAEYAKTGETGFEYAQKLTRRLRVLETARVEIRLSRGSK